ncbi:hypothetical protein BDV97DRAFT_198385 [Delphinella strobiligena]|nr:hypothetical protein BDV97DRAFT_198385 [Delphinella strobiligena]
MIELRDAYYSLRDDFPELPQGEGPLRERPTRHTRRDSAGQQIEKSTFEREDTVEQDNRIKRESTIERESSTEQESSTTQWIVDMQGIVRAQKRNKTPVQKAKKEVLPRMTSSQLRDTVTNSQVAKRKADEEADAWQEAQLAKRQCVSNDLNLSDMVVAERQWNQSGNFPLVVSPAQPRESTSHAQDIKETSDKELRVLRKNMSGLQLNMREGDVRPSIEQEFSIKQEVESD